MIKLSNLLSEIEVRPFGITSIYVGEPHKELFKVENFPAIPNIDGIPYEEREEYPKFWEIIEKIQEYLQNWDIQQIYFKGDFSSRNLIVYIYIDGESDYTIVDSLNHFGVGYTTEEGWEIQNWEEI